MAPCAAMAARDGTDASVECSHCGAKMPEAGVCPVCELPRPGASATASEAGDALPMQRPWLPRWWANGRLPLLLAAGCHIAACFLPLMRGIVLRDGRGNLITDITVRPVDLLLAAYPTLRGQMTSWLIPGAAVFLLSLLRSRTTARAMTVARPLVLVAALAPVVGAVMPFLRLRRIGMNVTPGAALGLVVLGAALGCMAATRFGEGEE